MRQFDIYTASGGTYSSKPRPIVIVQSVAFEEFDSITVLPITTVNLSSELRIEIEASDENGLETTSFVMIDKLTTIKKTALGRRIGQMDDRYHQGIRQKISYFIGG
jgi:mRNA interferase MazF